VAIAATIGQRSRDTSDGVDRDASSTLSMRTSRSAPGRVDMERRIARPFNLGPVMCW
jgi:hypothetical protein